MINMICDNCGAIINKSEEYCPNCGMELLTPKPVKKKYYRDPEAIIHENQSFKPAKNKYYKDSESFSNRPSIEKPIKRRYYEDSSPVSHDYSQYVDEDEYEESESPQQDHYEGNYKEKSGAGIGNIVLLLFIALILGFIAGLLIFGPQSTPQIPGFNV